LHKKLFAITPGGKAFRPKNRRPCLHFRIFHGAFRSPWFMLSTTITATVVSTSERPSCSASCTGDLRRTHAARSLSSDVVHASSKAQPDGGGCAVHGRAVRGEGSIRVVHTLAFCLLIPRSTQHHHVGPIWRANPCTRGARNSRTSAVYKTIKPHASAA